MNSLFLPDTTEELEEKSRRFRKSRSIQRWVTLFSSSAAAVAGGDGEKLLWIAQRWCALSRMRRRRTQGVGSTCVWLPLFLPHQGPSFLPL